MEEQIQNMTSIYASAFITIIAEQGENAHYGLRGLKGISAPRKLNVEGHRIGKHSIFQHVVRTDLKQSLWSQRGWTFQEQYMSPRRLVFNENTVYWECANSEGWENIIEILRLSTSTSKFLNQFQKPYPDFRRFFEIVQMYNIRHFTKPEDALRAFSGILSSLTKNFEGGFYCGIPVMYFDIAILWQPGEGVRRRVSSDPNNGIGIPSWSWAGWSGEILMNIDYLASFVRNSVLERPSKTTSLVQWYAYDIESGKQRHIVSSWRKHEALCGNDDTSVPRDWSRRPIFRRPAGDNAQSLKTSTSFYTFQHNWQTSFWFPVPMWEEGQQREPKLLARGWHLYCRTRKTRLHVTNRTNSYQAHNEIETKAREWAGVVFLNDNDPLREVSREAKFKSTELYEFAVLSLTERPNQSGVKDAATFPSVPPIPCRTAKSSWEDHWLGPASENPWEDPRSHKFYNVLMLEWKDGIAYRRALGQIKKDVWDRQVLEDFDLVLG